MNDREDLYRWQDARETRNKAWWQRKDAGQRPGPFPYTRACWRGPRMRQGHVVVIDRTLPPGHRVQFLGDPTIYAAGPNGAINQRFAVSKVLFSRNQARKALQSVRKRFPNARLQSYSWYPDKASLAEVEQVWGAGSIEKDQLVKVVAP